MSLPHGPSETLHKPLTPLKGLPPSSLPYCASSSSSGACLTSTPSVAAVNDFREQHASAATSAVVALTTQTPPPPSANPPLNVEKHHQMQQQPSSSSSSKKTPSTSSHHGPGNVQCPDAVHRVRVSSSNTSSSSSSSDLECSTATTTTTTTYLRQRLIGRGGFAHCFSVVEQGAGHSYALKVVDKQQLSVKGERAKAKLVREVEIHRRLRHSGIVAFHDVFEDRANVYMLLELCPHGTVADLVRAEGPWEEPRAATLLVQLTDSLKYLHARRVIHRDIKLSNLLVARDGSLRLADFGLACRLERGGAARTTICGTPNYIAPEVLSRSSGGHSYEADVWSVGVASYALMYGKPPFAAEDVKTTYRRIKARQFRFPEVPARSSDVRHLISWTLSTDPKERPSLDEIMSHPVVEPARQPGATRSLLLGGESSREPQTHPLPPAASTRKKKAAVASSPSSSSCTSVRTPLTLINANANAPSFAPVTPVPFAQQTMRQPEALTPLTTMAPNAINSDSNGTATKLAAAAEEAEEAEAEAAPFVPPALDLPTGDRNPSSPPRSESSTSSPIRVVTWLDYSSKYGICYRLMDGCVGALFNDGSRMVLAPNRTYVQYAERRRGGSGASAPPRRRLDARIAPPEDLRKKCRLLRHFETALSAADEKSGGELPIAAIKPDYDGELFADANGSEQADPESTSTPHGEPHNEPELPTVRRWLRTKHAAVFRLNAHVTHVLYFDGAVVLIVPETQHVHYRPAGAHASDPFEVSHLLRLPERPELVKRLRYAREAIKLL